MPQPANKDPMVFWTSDRIDRYDCDYNIIIGGRSDGKTVAIIGKIIRAFHQTGARGQYVRDKLESFTNGRAVNIMRSLEFAGENRDINLIEQWTDGYYTTTKYQSRAWYLGREIDNEDGTVEVIYEKDPFCYAVALSQVGHDKGATPANVGIIMLDEFIPVREIERPDIVDDFINMLTTTIRSGSGVKIYLLANTVTWNSAYYEHFGIDRDVPTLEVGEIRPYQVSDEEGQTVTLAVERVAPSKRKSGKRKPSDRYFLFGASKTSRMVTDGAFAIPQFPKCPHHYTSKDVKFTYWLEVKHDEHLRARLIKSPVGLFVFVDRIEEEVYEQIRSPRDVTYSLNFSADRRHFVSPTRPYDSHVGTGLMAAALANNRIFFENDRAGTDFVYYVNRAAQRTVLNP